MLASAEGMADSELLHQLQQLVTHLSAVLWLTTPDKREMTYVSPAFEQVYGVHPRELMARPALLFDLIHPDDRELVRAAMPKQAEGNWELRYRIVRTDGVHWLLARAFPVHDREGKLVRIAGITEDITADVEAEDALSRSRRRFEALTEHSGVGMWEIDQNGFTTYLNRAMCAQLEIDGAEDLRGQKYHQFFTAASLDTMRREHAKRGAGTPSSYQVEIVGKRGGVRQVMVNGAPILDEKGELLGLIGTFSDVTEMRQLEQALSQSQKLEAIGQLAAGVAHDFNNLLIPILGYSEMAIETLGEGQVSDDLQAVMQAGQQAKELTTQLLAFARKQALDMRPLVLGAEVTGFAPVLRRMLRENVSLDLLADDNAHAIRADATQIRQVLLNLTSNAQDAMPQGGKLRIRVRHVVFEAQAGATQHSLQGGHSLHPKHGPVPPGAYLELRVTDTGVGMDAATQARIFEPFFTTKPADAGTGLGLAMVYGCIRQHGGQIQCDSKPGAGTTFTLLFPALEGAELSRVSAASLPPLPSKESTILLVEDQEAVRSLVARVLLSEGYQVVQAADGREALERAEHLHGSIGLLVSDVIMPNMGGYELLDRLRVRNNDIRALFLSGYSEDGAATRRRLDAHFLPKPFAVDALKRVVRQVLANTPPAT